MSAFFETIGGLGFTILGAALTAGLCCIGSAKGTGMVGEAASGLVSEDPDKSTKCLILQVLPGTQGLYGFVALFIVLGQVGVLSGSPVAVTVSQGLAFFAACLPIMLGGWLSAVFQGRVAAASIGIVAKHPEASTKGIIFCGIVEFYAILSLVATIMISTNILKRGGCLHERNRKDHQPHGSRRQGRARRCHCRRAAEG